MSNSNGIRNTAFGNGALQNDDIGDYNTAIGNSALSNNTPGSANTATGENTLLFNTTGGNNTATGVDALRENTTGGNNTACHWPCFYWPFPFCGHFRQAWEFQERKACYCDATSAKVGDVSGESRLTVRVRRPSLRCK